MTDESVTKVKVDAKAKPREEKAKPKEKRVSWDLYMIRCGDGSLYTGISTDVQRRLSEHENNDKKNKGAKALRGKKPLTLVYQLGTGNKSEALKLEYRIKQLDKTEKETLINRDYDLVAVQKWLGLPWKA